ncbi:MAG: YIP1 family protein [Oscillospiraceae bacterium]|jgi:hypothetical protein|nr:YIP1 family protein [Oscillospiraceae bacterium]
MQTALQTQFTKNKLAYMLRTLSHPADAFYEIRHREQGSVVLSLICVAVFATCYTMNRIFASFIVNDADPMSVNGLTELSSVLLLVMLFAVGNWSVTCLLNGEGRFRDIVTVTGYSLLPLILCYVTATVVSRFVASGEEVFYTIIISLGTAWTAVLLLLGVMTVHNYTLLKTLGTLLLTVLSMFVMIFLALLLADMINQVVGFFYGIYIELIFRS